MSSVLARFLFRAIRIVRANRNLCIYNVFLSEQAAMMMMPVVVDPLPARTWIVRRMFVGCLSVRAMVL